MHRSGRTDSRNLHRNQEIELQDRRTDEAIYAIVDHPPSNVDDEDNENPYRVTRRPSNQYDRPYAANRRRLSQGSSEDQFSDIAYARTGIQHNLPRPSQLLRPEFERFDSASLQPEYEAIENYNEPSTIQLRQLQPPDLGLTEFAQKNLIFNQLNEFDENNFDEIDSSHEHIQTKNIKKIRKLRHVSQPLKYRRLVFRDLLRQTNLGKDGIENLDTKNQAGSKKFYQLWKERLDSSVSFSPWGSTIKSIEGKFGSGIGSYFRFLEFLLLFNFSIFLISFGFVVVPQLIFRYYNSGVDIGDDNFYNGTFKFEDLFTAKGWLADTELLYGAYTFDNVTIGDGFSYSMTRAYFFSTGIIYIFWLIILSATMARSYKRFFIDSQSLSSASSGEFSKKVFSGWDFAIMGQKAQKRKERSLTVDFKEMCQKLARKRSMKKRKEVPRFSAFDFGLWTLRLGAWLLVGLVLGGIGYATYAVLEEFQENPEELFWQQMAVAGIVTLFILVLPIFFAFLSSLSRYGESDGGAATTDLKMRHSMYATLLKTLILEIVALGVVAFYYFKKSGVEDSNECWENGLGQEMYRLLIFFLIGLVLVSFIFDQVQNLIHWRLGFIPLAKFDIARETTQLIYGQTITWLGLYFSPLLPLVFIFILVITFYIKRFNLFLSNRLSRDSSSVFKPWRAAQSKTVFLVATFISLMAASLGIAYVISSVRPSKNCGPFRYYTHAYDVLDDEEGLMKIPIFYPSVAVGINIIIAVALYYIVSMGVYRRRELKVYQKRLKHHKKENLIVNEALLNLREMLMKKSRMPVRRGSSLQSSRQPSSIILRQQR